MIRRTFWLGAGAAAGILSYRRVAALGRRLAPGTVAVTRERHTVRDTVRFARDVREGMDIYTSRRALPSGAGDHDRKEGR